MSTNFKSLMGKYNFSSPRERILLLTLAGTIAIAGTYWLTAENDTSNAAGTPPSVKPAVKAPVKPEAQLPLLAISSDQAMRNPFLPPLEYQQHEEGKAPAIKPGDTSRVPSKPERSTPPSKPKDYSNLDALLRGTGKNSEPQAQTGRPGLVGIVEGAGKRLAIINYGGDSRSYGNYERIGPYQITSISSSSVILSGPAGRTVLAVGR